ncbi:MAG TPA: DUF4262 domain-containing protein [Chthoniobacteraceae bacterium]|nr:DUF4262 domain-containing protein [Chthoniobacteraceae bacterium]
MDAPQAKYKDSVKSPKIPGFVWQEPENDHDVKLYRDITVAGCTILVITPDSIEDPNPPYDFVYTVGFYLNLSHPEFFIKGVSGNCAGNMMNQLFAYVESGHKIEEGHTVRHDFGMGEKKLVAKLVPQEVYFDYLGWGCWFYRSLIWNVSPIAEHKFPVLQLFWPDPNGFYPWDANCNQKVREVQTLVPQPDEE